MRRKISIFGSTGSIGTSTVSLIEDQGGIESHDVVALTGGRNIPLLADQARRLRPGVAVTAFPEKFGELREALSGTGIRCAAGPEALLEAADEPADWIMSAIVGAAGLAPGLRAARHGGTIALANKESLVCAGRLFLETCERHGTRLLPVDSEHSAIFQAMTGESRDEIDRIVLTASGGPFRTWPLDRLETATPEQARKHPNWDMGERISIDSASMFNKALEVIEAGVLFGARPDQIEVVVHPQSVIHSMVGFTDGAIMAHLGPTDMRGAIGYALNWPKRRPLGLDRLNFTDLARLDFHPVDNTRFPAIELAYKVLDAGGLTGAVFNAAKETALDGFLARDIGFLDMARLVAHVTGEMLRDATAAGSAYDLFQVEAMDTTARRQGRDWIKKHGRS